MPYTNAVYYMDYVLGSDAARAAQNIAASTFTTPIKITIVGHGLVTGAVVTVAGHLVNTNANGDWKITWVDADNFTLDTSVGNGIGVATGTVTPWGGAVWGADAWKSITGGVAGAIAAHIAPGDIIRLAKSPDPVAIGNATWNDLSKTITLAAAQTLNIDLCEVAWTKNPAGDATVTLTPVATDAKEGANCMKVALDAAVQANIMQAYYATGNLDLSAYQKISFWIKNSGAIVATNWVLNLCSDVAGATVVDSFPIPPIPSTGQWVPLTITKAGGGNLGALIKSIALWTGASVVGMASKEILVDNFIACTTAGLNLQSLISKNGLAQGGTEGFYGIQSINGVTVLLDNVTNTKANAGRGYSGTTELVATYIRETIKTDMAAGALTLVQWIQDSGTAAGGNIQFQGGYDTALNTQIGETFFDGLNGLGIGIYLESTLYTTQNYLSVTRYRQGVTCESSYNNIIITLSNANNNYVGVYFDYGYNNVIISLGNANNNGGSAVWFTQSHNNVIIALGNANNNLNSGMYFFESFNNIIALGNANNNTSSGVQFEFSPNNIFRALSTAGNGASGVNNDVGVNYLYKAVIAEATTVAGWEDYADSRIYSQQEDGTVGNNWIYTDYGTINSEANTRPGGLGLEWKLAILGANRSSSYPLYLSIAKFAVVANKLVTFKAYLTKSHATDVAGYIVCKGGQIAGVPADVIATKADDVNPQQLTITFTPTEAGTVEILAGAYYVAANGNVLVDTISITQA